MKMASMRSKVCAGCRMGMGCVAVGLWVKVDQLLFCSGDGERGGGSGASAGDMGKTGSIG